MIAAHLTTTTAWSGFRPIQPQNPVIVRQDAWERQHITSDACGHMADVAQQQANEALRANGNNPAKALAGFDDQFGVIYDGRAMNEVVSKVGPLVVHEKEHWGQACDIAILSSTVSRF